MPLRRLLTVLTLTTGLAATGAAQASERAEAKLMDLDGKQIGTVTFHALPSGGIWLIATAEGIAPGATYTRPASAKPAPALNPPADTMRRAAMRTAFWMPRGRMPATSRTSMSRAMA